MLDFCLPDRLIARHPVTPRSHSRLLAVTRHNHESFGDYRFYQLPDLLRPGDLLVINDSRVIPARLTLRKQTGGAVEVLFERALTPTLALALIGSNKPLRSGTHLYLHTGDACVEVLHAGADVRKQIKLISERYTSWQQLIQAQGEVPLPPYMRRSADVADRGRYQTVYASYDGSVAAPTAGLHFDTTVLSALQRKGVEVTALTLHVGYGTFASVDPDTTELHAERFDLPQQCVDAVCATRARGGRVIAVGTTSVRVLESVALVAGSGRLIAQQGETRLCIKPGFVFQVIDGMITNFHLPHTSLLWLVSALAGQDTVTAAYHYAIDHEYRFYSYGDAMLIV